MIVLQSLKIMAFQSVMHYTYAYLYIIYKYDGRTHTMEEKDKL